MCSLLPCLQGYPVQPADQQQRESSPTGFTDFRGQGISTLVRLYGTGGTMINSAIFSERRCQLPLSLCSAVWSWWPAAACCSRQQRLPAGPSFAHVHSSALIAACCRWMLQRLPPTSPYLAALAEQVGCRRLLGYLAALLCQWAGLNRLSWAGCCHHARACLDHLIPRLLPMVQVTSSRDFVWSTANRYSQTSISCIM